MKSFLLANLKQNHILQHFVSYGIQEQETFLFFSGVDGKSSESEICEFKARVVAFEVQKNFANKFFSNKIVAKSLIDEKSGNLLDNLYFLLYVFVSKIKDTMIF